MATEIPKLSNVSLIIFAFFITSPASAFVLVFLSRSMLGGFQSLSFPKTNASSDLVSFFDSAPIVPLIGKLEEAVLLLTLRSPVFIASFTCNGLSSFSPPMPKILPIAWNIELILVLEAKIIQITNIVIRTTVEAMVFKKFNITLDTESPTNPPPLPFEASAIPFTLGTLKANNPDSETIIPIKPA